MSPTGRPSKVSGLRRGIASPPDERAPFSEDLKEFSSAVKAQQETARPPRRPRPEKPVRFTLDLDRTRHTYLKEYAAQIEASASEIIRELLDEMQADDDLRARVRARIWQRPR